MHNFNKLINNFEVEHNMKLILLPITKFKRTFKYIKVIINLITLPYQIQKSHILRTKCRKKNKCMFLN